MGILWQPANNGGYEVLAMDVEQSGQGTPERREMALPGVRLLCGIDSGGDAAHAAEDFDEPPLEERFVDRLALTTGIQLKDYAERPPVVSIRHIGSERMSSHPASVYMLGRVSLPPRLTVPRDSPYLAGRFIPLFEMEAHMRLPDDIEALQWVSRHVLSLRAV